MKRMMLLLGLFASLVIGSTTLAQAPPVPPPGIAPVAAPPAPSNIWTMLMPNKDQCSHIKTCFCESGIGQMITGMVAPMSLMSGGLIQNRCLQNSILNDLKKPADTPEGAAARIAADEAAAKARRASVRALGLVDCNYWPEAIDVLTMSLRKDRSECVRFEAALALRNGCCCNKATIKALEMSVSGSNADGFPAERSERVRAVAGEALANCPIIENVIEGKKPETLTKNQLIPNVDPTEYYKKVAMMPNEQIITSARNTLASVQQATKNQAEGNAPAAQTIGGPANTPMSHQRAGNLAGVISNAFNGSADPQTRTPFFSSLTRSLTGKQENTMQQFGVPAAPSPMSTAQLPEFQTIAPAQIVAPTPMYSKMPTVIAPAQIVAPTPMYNKMPPVREKPLMIPVEIQPSADFLNPPREKSVTPRDAQSKNAAPKTAGSEYIQVSPHVRQFQPTPKKAPVELIPATPDLPPTPAPMKTQTSAVSPTILPATYVRSLDAPTPNFTVINMSPTTSNATPIQMRESRPTLPPEIVQSGVVQPRETRGIVTLEIGPR